MNSNQSRSAELYQRALRVLPGGISRNAILRKPHPPYAKEGHGCYVTDVDGRIFLDFANNIASLIHGHAHPAIVEAVTQQLQRGSAFTMATEAEILLAEHMVARSDSFDRIRFLNSGTEAVMAALKASRAFTGRPKIAKVEGAYHGLYDYAEISQTAAPENWGDEEAPRSSPVAHGTPQRALDDVVVIPFNNADRALRILDRHVDELACVLVDPMPHRVGLVPACAEFIRALRQWTRRHNTLLVFDEVVTFRSNHGGAQEWFVDRPDLTALGKMIGGGFPVGALAGRSDVMEVLNPLITPLRFPQSGTFSANPITMTAGRVAMEMFDRDAVARLNALGETVRGRIADLIREAGLPACVVGGGSMFRIHMKPEPPLDYRAGYVGPCEKALISTMLDHCFSNGVVLINTCTGTLSTPMGSKEIDQLCEVLRGGFAKLQPMTREWDAIAKPASAL